MKHTFDKQPYKIHFAVGITVQLGIITMLTSTPLFHPHNTGEPSLVVGELQIVIDVKQLWLADRFVKTFEMRAPKEAHLLVLKGVF